MSKKYLIYGAYGEANIGDDLLLKVLLDWLQENNIKQEQIYISSDDMEYLKNKYSGVNVLSKYEAKKFDVDVLVLGGGTQFFDFGSINKSFINEYLKKINKYLSEVYLKWLRQNKGVNYDKKIAMGLGLGPFRTKGSEIIVKRRLQDFDAIFSRDPYTHSLCEKFKLNSYSVADICFSKYFKESFNYIHQHRKGERSVIGVVLRDWPHDNRGEIINKKILSWMAENMEAYEFQIFVFSEKKDAHLINYLNAKTPYSIKVWDPQRFDYKTYLQEFSKIDIAITSRFHGGVFAANFLIPTICLGIDPKLKYLAESIRGFEYLKHTDNKYLLNNYISDIENNYEALQILIQEDVEKLSIKSNKQFQISNKIIF